jgi:hypothetical protein
MAPQKRSRTPSPLRSTSPKRIKPTLSTQNDAPPTTEITALSLEEKKLYDRQIRLWGVEAQQR